MAQIRLDKFLAGAGLGTRSEVKNYIRKGQVTVDGREVKKPETKIDEENAQVWAAGRRLTYTPFEYHMLHKPAGCVTATKDNQCATVMDYVTSPRKGELFPVGRLDKDTEGLLLITNDGALAHELLSPKKHVEKTYYARIRGQVTAEDVRKFQEGLDIGDDHPTLPAGLKLLAAGEESEVLVTVCEGRFHQVKRMFEAVGKTVVYLKRLSMGPLALDENMPAGACRMLTEEEQKRLRGLL